MHQDSPLKLEFELSPAKRVAVELSGQDLLEEVRTFLMEQSQMVLFDNFHFALKGRLLHNYVPLAELDVPAGSVVQVQVGAYELKSVLHHYHKSVHFLSHPALIAYYFHDSTKTAPSPQDKPDKDEDQSVDKWLRTNLANYSRLSESQPILSGQHLVHSISRSGFNPPTGPRVLSGDLLYLQVLTLENQHLHITCSTDGFYVNRSEQKHFDGMPKSATYLSLLELLSAQSPCFAKTWERLVSDRSLVAKGSQLITQQQLGYRFREKEWTKDSRRQEWDVNANEKSLSDSLQTKTRDWNEELQLVKELPGKDFLERINKTKVLAKVYAEFTECCREGVQQIVQGNVQPLNFYENEAYRIYQWNNVFFTVLAENTHHFQAAVKNAQGESHPTVANGNQDLRNLQVLENYMLNNNEGEDRIEGLHLVNTVLVDYKGTRVLCQSIIPGILNDIQHSFKQGCMDEGCTVMKDPAYDALIGQLSKLFGLKQALTFPSEQDSLTLQGSLEVKGIEGQDNKKYVLDLLRLSPRDLNYPSPDQSGCVLRHELIESYQMVSAIKQVESKLKSEYDQPNDTNNQALKKQIEEQTDPEKKKALQEELGTALQKQYVDRINKVQKMMADKSHRQSLHLNPTIGTAYEATDSTPQEKEQLATLAEFLKSQMIPQLIQDLSVGDQIKICDSASFSEVFHQYGVNNRYLGLVLSQVDPRHHHLRLMMQRVLVVRCLKHLLRQTMHNTPFSHMAKVISHFMNLLFASSVPSAQEPAKEEKQVEPNKKRKKNKSKKTQPSTQPSTFGVSMSAVPELSLTKESLWEQVRQLAHDKYSYTLCDKIEQLEALDGPYNKLAALRDLCKRTGVKIRAREYKMGEEVVFDKEDILEVVPVVKAVSYQSQDVKAHLETGERLHQEGKAKEALECYSQLCQLITNLFGHNHKDLATVFQKLSSLYLSQKDLQNALLYQKEAYRVYANLRGSDDRHSAQALMTLGLYCHKTGLQDKALKYTKKALYFMSLLGGETYADCLVCFVNLANIYMDQSQHQMALALLFECLDSHARCFAPGHFLVLYVYRHIVTAHREIGDLKRAIEYQQKVLAILSSQKEEKTKTHQSVQLDMFIQNEKNVLAHLQQQVEQKINKNQLEEKDGKRQFGQNKAKKQQPTSQPIVQNDRQKEELKERLKLAKLTKITGRQGFRPNQQLNQNLYWINQQAKDKAE